MQSSDIKQVLFSVDLDGKVIGVYFVLAGHRCFGIVLAEVRSRVFSRWLFPGDTW